MLRCPDGSAGAYRVTFSCVENDGTPDPAERNITIGTIAGAHGAVYRADNGDVRISPDSKPAPEFAGDNRKWELIEEVPHTRQSSPYEGELCLHELAWVQSLPGQHYSRHWRFGVEEV